MSKLNEALQTGNIPSIKSSILAYLSADPLDKSGEVKNAISTIDSKRINIWQSHDEDTPLFADTSKWTKDYFAELQSHLVVNFSKPCLELALNVGRHAYREELNRPKEPVRPRVQTNHSQSQSQSNSGNDNMGKLLVAGAAVLVAGIAIYFIVK